MAEMSCRSINEVKKFEQTSELGCHGWTTPTRTSTRTWSSKSSCSLSISVMKMIVLFLFVMVGLPPNNRMEHHYSLHIFTSAFNLPLTRRHRTKTATGIGMPSMLLYSRAFHRRINHNEDSIEINNSSNNNQKNPSNTGIHTTKVMDIFKASMLIAGTTVGGGFLALPGTVVVPLGSFGVTAASLFGVWAFFLAQSFVLMDCLVECQEKNSIGTSHTKRNSVIGFPSLAKYALGSRGSWATTALLVVLTEASLVSQISRAGSLLAENNGVSFLGSGATSGMLQYRIGCILAAVIGAVVSFSRRTRKKGFPDATNAKELETKLYSSDEESNTEQNEAFDGNDTESLAATDFNALLTIVFLVSAVLLFQAGSQTADWSRCFLVASAGQMTPILLLRRILGATPTMLQLLAYGEILPNVCSMLQYHVPSIRTAISIGSTIPLVLLVGWAGLGLALLPQTSPTPMALLTGTLDPVDILIASGNGPIRTRLLVLAASAIGTTVLGCFLALESTYDDVLSVDLEKVDNAQIVPSPSCRGEQWRRSRAVKLITLVLPPLAISAISPNVFLRAIDFAGSYPVLLLWGVLPPFMALRMQFFSSSKSPPTPKLEGGNLDKPKGSTVSSTSQRDRARRRFWYILLASISSAMVGMNGLRDLGGMVGFLTSYCSNYIC